MSAPENRPEQGACLDLVDLVVIVLVLVAAAAAGAGWAKLEWFTA